MRIEGKPELLLIDFVQGYVESDTTTHMGQTLHPISSSRMRIAVRTYTVRF